MKTIAIIEDDLHIGAILEKTLKKEGYRVLRAYSGTEAVYLLEKENPDLVLLDLMLPGLSGEELLPRIQGIPVIVVSAKAGVDDKVQLLLKGAADYVTKPFEMKELLARIQVQLRKQEKPGRTNRREAGSLSMNTDTHQVWVGKQEIKLTRTEYAILKFLMQNPEQVIAKSVILEEISRDTPDCTDSSLKQHISNLRRKLGQAGDKEYIESVWGIGFRLTCEKTEN